MEQRMEPIGSTCVGTMNQTRNVRAIGFLAASEQLHTRCCARCAGLLVHDWCYDLINNGEHNAEIFRCVQCGHRVDPVILRNQVRPPVEHACAGRT